MPKKPILKSRANSQVKRSLSFATFESYPACPGYEYPTSNAEIADVIQAGYDCPQIRKRVSLPTHITDLDTDIQIQFGRFRNFQCERACMERPDLAPSIPPTIRQS
jgi:hypothetical protein